MYKHGKVYGKVYGKMTNTHAHEHTNPKKGEENQRRYACRELKVKKYKTVRCKE